MCLFIKGCCNGSMPPYQKKEQLSFSGTERISSKDRQIRVCYKNPTKGHLCSFEIWQKQEKKLKLYSSTSEFLLNSVTHELWILANYPMSYHQGFHQKHIDDDKKPQGSLYASTKNIWVTLQSLKWYINIKYYQHY